MKNRKIKFMTAYLVLFLTIYAPAQSGGDFAITQSVVAGGGGQNAGGGGFSLDGTIGQSVAGNALTNSPFSVTSGFWNFTPAAPTAASVDVGGRVITVDGRGIRSVRLVLTAPNGETRTAISSSFGYYKFVSVPVGETYIIAVYSKRYAFSQPVIIRTVLDSISDLDFIAEPV